MSRHLVLKNLILVVHIYFTPVSATSKRLRPHNSLSLTKRHPSGVSDSQYTTELQQHPTVLDTTFIWQYQPFERI